jgi:hypothetical protein
MRNALEGLKKPAAPADPEAPEARPVEEGPAPAFKEIPAPEKITIPPAAAAPSAAVQDEIPSDEAALIWRSIPKALPRKKPKDTRRRDPVVSYRGIPPAVTAELKRIAEQELDVSVGVLARFYFEHGLQSYQEGRLRLVSSFINMGYSLYTETWKDAGKLRRPRPKKGKEAQRANPVAFRGLPPSLRDRVAALAQELGVPVGEVARKLIEYGNEQYRRGLLPLTLYPVETSKRTLFVEEKGGPFEPAHPRRGHKS